MDLKNYTLVELRQLAKENGVKYILQGSELDEKYNKWLIGKGYRPFCFRKEV